MTVGIAPVSCSGIRLSDMDMTPLPENPDELLRSLCETGLPPDLVTHLAAQARPAILLVTTAGDEDSIPLGAAKIGGCPDLPRGTAWPMRPPYPDGSGRAGSHRWQAAHLLADSRKRGSWMTREQGERFSREAEARAVAVEAPFPLAFLGQFDLVALAQEKAFDPIFPDEGRLLLFYDYWEQPESFTPEASVGWRLLWDTTPVSELVRAPIPDALASISNAEWTCVFRGSRITPRSVLTPIPPDDESWDAFPRENDAMWEIYQQWLEQFGLPDADDRDNHQFGGFPQTLQNGLQATCQLVANGVNCGGGPEIWESEAAKTLLQSAKDWRLVLQIGTDRHAEIPGPGAYYVLMREEDIIARRFERARVHYQCD